MITRRTFLNQSALAACSLALPVAAESDATITGRGSLKAHAHARGLLAGCAVSAANLKEEAFTRTLVEQYSLVVAENAMKFGPIKPKPDAYFFDDADALVNFAHTHNIKVRGHNFVWHNQLPAWFNGVATKDNAKKILTDHIMTVGSRYKGKIQSWDVVNEAILVSDGRPDGLRRSPWLELVGPDYLEIAYRTAHQADPHAKLCYNEYDIESESESHAAKRAATLALLKRLKAANVPLHALGIQSHIKVGESWGNGLRELIDGAKALGLDVYLTELDVNDKSMNETDPAAAPGFADPAALVAIDKAVADVYTSYLSVALENKAVKSVLTWGLTDAHTWLAGMRRRNTDDKQPPRLPQRPLPFDPDYKPAPAFFAMRNAIDKAPHR